MEALSTHPLILLVAVPFSLLGYRALPFATILFRRFWAAVLLLLSAVLGYQIYGLVSSAISQKRDWDFLFFWLAGRVISQGLDPYDPKSFQTQPLPFIPGAEFYSETFGVGMSYTPTSAPLFWGLGFFDYSTAFAIWHCMMALALVLAIYFSAKYLLKQLSAQSLLLTTTLLLLLRPTASIFWFGQTTLLILVGFLLFLGLRNRTIAGFFLGSTLVVKPYTALLLCYPVLRREWRPLAGATVALCLVLLHISCTIGLSSFLHYVERDIPHQLPFYAHVQGNNQSLASIVAHLTQLTALDGIPADQPLYLTVAIIIISLTFIRIISRRRETDPFGFAALLLAALLVYPNTLEHYSALLIIPCLLLWQRYSDSRASAIATTALITSVYLLTGYHGGKFSFVAHALLWCIYMVLDSSMSEQHAAKFRQAPTCRRSFSTSSDGLGGAAS